MKYKDTSIEIQPEVLYEPSDTILDHPTDSIDLGNIFTVKGGFTLIVYQHGMALYNLAGRLIKCQKFDHDLGSRVCVASPNKIFVIGASSIVVILDPFLFDYRIVQYSKELPVPHQGTVWNHSLVFASHSGIYRLEEDLSISRIITNNCVKSIAADEDGSLVYCEHVSGNLMTPNYKLFHLKNNERHLITSSYFEFFNCLNMGDGCIAASSSNKTTIYYNVRSLKTGRKLLRTVYDDPHIVKGRSTFSLTPYGAAKLNTESYSCKHNPESSVHFCDIQTDPFFDDINVIK